MKLERLLSTPKALLAIKKQSAFTMVEILLAVSVFALLVTAFSGVYLYGEEASALAGNRARATLIAQEGLEAVQNMRDANFTNLVDGTYGLGLVNNHWVFSGTEDIVDTLFTRSIAIDTNDADRKNIVVTVSWQQNPQRLGSVTLASLLSFWQKVVYFVGDWTDPNVLLISMSMGGNDALKVKISGSYAYVIQSTISPGFSVVNISNPEDPFRNGAIELSAPATSLYYLHNYVYLASSDPRAELQIIDVIDPLSLALVGSSDVDTSMSGAGIYVVDNTAYLTTVDEGGYGYLNIFDIHRKDNPKLLSSLYLEQGVDNLVVAGSYAFIASKVKSRELLVVDVSNLESPTLVNIKEVNQGASEDARTINIALGVNKIFIGRDNLFFALDISTLTDPIVLGSYETSGNINDIYLNSTVGYAFVAVDYGELALQILDFNTPEAIGLVGTFGTAEAPTGVVYDVISDKVYLVGPTDEAEFQVIGP